MPLTFPDGSTTVLRFDPALGLDRMKVRPYQWGRIGDSMRDFDCDARRTARTVVRHPAPFRSLAPPDLGLSARRRPCG